VDELADYLVKKWTDPNDPDNLLKRPTWRVCMNCEGEYMSRLRVLADSGFCSEACKEATKARANALLSDR